METVSDSQPQKQKLKKTITSRPQSRQKSRPKARPDSKKQPSQNQNFIDLPQVHETQSISIVDQQPIFINPDNLPYPILRNQPQQESQNNKTFNTLQNSKTLNVDSPTRNSNLHLQSLTNKNVSQSVLSSQTSNQNLMNKPTLQNVMPQFNSNSVFVSKGSNNGEIKSMYKDKRNKKKKAVCGDNNQGFESVSQQDINKIEEKIKLLDSLLVPTDSYNNHKQTLLFKNQNQQSLKSSLQKIKQAELLTNSIQIYNQGYEDEFLNQNSQHQQYHTQQQSRMSLNNNKLIPLTNSSIVSQAELLFGQGRKDSQHNINKQGFLIKEQDNHIIIGSQSVSQSQSKGIKGAKKILKNIYQSNEKKQCLNNDIDFKQNEMEIILQVNRKRPNSEQKTIKLTTNKQTNQQSISQYINQSHYENNSYSTKKQDYYSSQQSNRNKNKQQYRQLSNDQSKHHYSHIENKSNNSQDKPYQQSQNNNSQQSTIVIKINNLNNQQQPQFQIIGNNNFVVINQQLTNNAKIKTDINRNSSIKKDVKQINIQNRAASKHIKKDNNQNDRSCVKDTQSFHNSDLQSVHSSFFQDRMQTPGGSSLRFNKSLYNKTPLENPNPKQLNLKNLLQQKDINPQKSYVGKLSNSSVFNNQNNSIIIKSSIDNISSSMNKMYSSFNIGYSEAYEYQRQKSISSIKAQERIIESNIGFQDQYLDIDSYNERSAVDNSINEQQMIKLLSKRNYIKLKRQNYSIKQDQYQYNNRSYINSLEIKERVAASNLIRNKSKEMLKERMQQITKFT